MANGPKLLLEMHVRVPVDLLVQVDAEVRLRREAGRRFDRSEFVREALISRLQELRGARKTKRG